MRRCFLDIDGVLADWIGGVHRALGIPYDPQVWPYKKGPKGWHFHNEIGWSFEAVSQLCNFEFWTGLRWTHDGRDILREVFKFHELSVTLLTTPMPNVMSASGKVAWVYEHLPEFKNRLMICTDSKSILAEVPGAVLIDDNQGNVDKWRAAGGSAVLVPRWWNDMYVNAQDAPLSVKLGLETLLCHES